MIRGTVGYRAGMGGDVFEGFAASFICAWGMLLKERPGDQFYFMRGLSPMLHDSANQLALHFKGDWFLMCDYDHVFPADNFAEMIETFEDNELDILSGFYQARHPPYLPIAYTYDFHPYHKPENVIPNKDQGYELLPIDLAGAGCLMIRRNVIEAMLNDLGETPFHLRSKFSPKYWKAAPRGIWQGTPPEGVFNKLLPGHRWDDVYWEDFSFFWRAKLLGFKAFLAPWIKFYHVEKRLVSDALIERQGVIPHTDFSLPLHLGHRLDNKP